MIAAAIVQDLLTVAAHHQHQPLSTLVLVDEFSAVAPDGIARLFGRGRSAGMSLLLGTQELADLTLVEHPNLKDQVLGNVTTLIAHRQVIPDTAEQIAAIAGTRGTWVHTQRTDHRLNGQGTERRHRHPHPRPRVRRSPRRDQTAPDRVGASSPAPAAPNPGSPGCCTPRTHDDHHQPPRHRPARPAARTARC